MAEIKHFKVVASLPSPLEPDSIYYVRVGQGYDQYVTNGVGIVVAYEANSKLNLENKVDKESGKQLSDENYTLDEKNKLASLENYDDSAIQSELDTKVDKVVGKQLSTEDYSTEEKNKLSGVEAGAQVNTVTSVAGKTGAVTLNKTDVGLSNVDNTSDSDKPVSTAQQEALNLKLDANANAVSASKLATPRTISLSGDASGSTSFDGSANATIEVEVADDSHNHVISNVDGLQAELDSKVDKVAGKQLSDENYTLAEKNKLAGVAVEATKNATDAQLRARSTHTGTQPISTVSGLEDELADKVSISDSRLTNSREWTATTVSQAEAEAGTATTRRAWTAQRVRQAIVSWWDSSAFKTKLDGIATGATKNATDAQLRDRATHTGVQPISSVSGLQSELDSKADTTYVNTQLATKVDKVVGKELSTNDFTDQLRDKLASLESSHFRGTFTSKGDLEVAIPVAEAGDYADVDVAGQDAERYIWDSSDSIWVLSTTKPAPLTAAQIKQMYESNPDTNPFDDAAEAKLDGIATGATKNATDAQLRARSTHTGTQPISTVAGLSASLNSKADQTSLDDVDASKVDKEEGKGLSTNDFTTTEKNKLGGIEAGAQVNTVTSVAGKTGAVTLTHTDVNAAPVSHTHPLSQITDAGDLASLNTNASTSNFLRGDGTWATPPNTNTTYSAGTGITLTGTTFSLTDERFTSAMSTKLGGIASGATANATNAQLRDRATHTGVQPIASVDGLQDALGGKVDSTDSRLSDSREWTATVVSQAEAQAGTSTTARKWTALRVSQAISALGLSIGTTATTAKAGNWMPTWANVTGKPTTFTPSAHTHSLDQITDAGSVASLDTTGSTTAFLRGDGTWVTPPNTNTTYSEITTAEIDAGTASTLRTITGRRMKYALDKKADTVHEHSISDVTGLQAGLNNKADTTYVDDQLGEKVDKTVSVVAGTGLSGGGTLSADRTLNVQYGTTAGTAAQGNDSRLSNSREWTASTVPQAEAEAGTATTRRAWTSQRVRQSVAAYTEPFTSSDKSKLDGIAAGAQVNVGTNLGSSGTGATRTITSSTGSNTSITYSAADVGAVPTARTITAGTGLTGGGTLAANRTLSVAYGTAAGTAAQGNDSRLSDSREWTATTVSQAEAEAGTATARRAWTAQRVAQAISALGLSIGTTATTAKAGNWMPTWANVTGKPTTFTPATHNHSAGEITSGVLAYARIPTIRHGDTNFANQDLNTDSSVQHATVRTGGTVDDGTNSLQVDGGTRTDTLAAGGVQAAEESIDTDGNVQVRGEGQLKMGDFAIQYNAATKSLDFNFMET